MKKIAFYTACLLLVSACIYPYSLELDKEVSQSLVIEGDILVGDQTVVKLSYVQNLNQSQGYSRITYPSGTVWVECDNGDSFPADLSLSDLTRGQYVIPGTLEASLENRYRLVVEAEGNKYASDWLTPNEAPVVNCLSFSADDYNVKVAISMEGGPQASGYAGITFEETWEFHVDYAAMYGVNPKTWQVEALQNGYPNFWCWRRQNNLNFILIDYTQVAGGVVKEYPFYAFSRSDNRNHRRYSIIARVRNLSEEEFRYRKNLNDNSDIGGDLFSPNPGELKGNILCETNPDLPVYGYIAACKVASKREFLDGIYWKRSVIPDWGLVIPADADEMEYYYYEKNYRPIDMMVVDDRTGVAWGPMRCMDCIAAGGTKERPDFWEE